MSEIRDGHGGARDRPLRLRRAYVMGYWSGAVPTLSVAEAARSDQQLLDLLRHEPSSIKACP